MIYCPLRDHSRAEASVFFLRIKNGTSYSPPPAQGIFSDVPLTAWSAPWVEAAYNDGLLPACSASPLAFCPDNPLDRAWAAYMMVMAKGGLAAFGAGETAAPTPTLIATLTETPTVAPSSTQDPIPTDTATPELQPSPTGTPSPTPDNTPTSTSLALLRDLSAERVSRHRLGIARYWS